MTIAISAARIAELGGNAENPFVLWDNKAVGAEIVLNVPIFTDGPGANALTPTTYDYWKPVVTTSAQAIFRVTLPGHDISCVGIASHNIGGLGASVSVIRSYDGVNWTDGGAGSITPFDDSPIMFRMATAGSNSYYWAVVVDGLSWGDALAVGVIFFGNELVFPTRFYAGFAPVLSATEVELQSNVSQGNHLLGSSVVSRGSTLSAAFTYVEPGFVRGAMLPFQRYFNEGGGFFFAWRPGTYSGDLHYCWRNGETLRPTNDGARDFMAFTLAMRSHDG